VVALFLLWAVLLLRDGKEKLGAWFATGIAAYAICSAPNFALPNSVDWKLPLLMLSIGNSMMFWFFSRRLFEEGFAIRLKHWLTYLSYVGIALFILLNSHGLFTPKPLVPIAIVSITSIGFGIAASWIIYKGHADDLVEQRRAFRPIMMGGAVLYVLAIAASEIRIGIGTPPPGLSLLNALVLLGFGFAVLLTLTKGATGQMFAPARQINALRKPTDSELPLVQSLNNLFIVQKIHREPNLTIADVSRLLKIPEYKLRALVNQHLGYSNFATFVNAFRLDEAQLALGAASQLSVPISTIALDAGFGSLGVFNRAFKLKIGVTPSQFRQKHCK
jgi:AraC-like DNA-binding protein